MEKYFELRMWQDYIIPAILIMLLVASFLIGWAVSRFSIKLEEREKRINDRLWKKFEEMEEDGKANGDQR